MTQTRKLNESEISDLNANGCTAVDWSDIFVGDNFTADKLKNVHFGRNVVLGNFDDKLLCGLYNVHLNNCVIGDNCYIRNIGTRISDYVIGCNCRIENCDGIYTTGETAFGNGTVVTVHNEAGGREIRIHHKLTAQAAYMLCFYKSYKNTEKNFAYYINKDIDEICRKETSACGYIGDDCSITNSGLIVNTKIGSHTIIEGAGELHDGTIMGGSGRRTYIGRDVIARNFIISSQCKIDSACIIDKCFVGEHVQMGKQFSATDSLIFCNSELFHGEACSIFAGPFTVSHHKATLLIAGMFSFFNAGSGSNQSNHLYKNGPRHSGVLERGCKLASGSYLMWPARAAAFTTILGKHSINFDSGKLPFSYIIETSGTSFIKPGINIYKKGTARDIDKWVKRDVRTKPKTDAVCFDATGPYILSKLSEAVQYLSALKESRQDEHRNIAVVESIDDTKKQRKQLFITTKDLEKGLHIYEDAYHAFLCNRTDAIYKRILTENPSASFQDLACISQNADYCEQWADIAGLIAPFSAITQTLDLMAETQAGIDSFNKAVYELFEQYDQKAEQYVVKKFFDTFKITTQNDFDAALKKGKALSDEINDKIREDGQKEESGLSKIGFGLDFTDQDSDFKMVNNR